MTIFSVIIPCINNSVFLEKNIKGLEKQSFKKFEVVIASENNFKNKIKKNSLNIKFLNCKNILTPGAKRNLAAKNSRGEYLVFIDDDAYPDKNWLNNIYKYFVLNKNFKTCVGGPGLIPPDSNFSGKSINLFYTSKIFYSDQHRYISSKSHNKKFVSDWPSFNFAINRNFFLKIGGFNKKFWPGEDSKLCEKIIKLKGTIIYLSNSIVYHYNRISYFKFFKQVFRYGYHRGKFLKMGDENSKLFKYFLPSLFFIFHLILLFDIKLFYYFVLTLWCILFVEGCFKYNKSINILHILLSRFLIHIALLTYGLSFLKGIFSKKYKISLNR